MARREEANYTRPRFCEPSAPPHLAHIASAGVRKSVNSYLDDDLYMFDADHAMIAFPLAAIREVARRPLRLGREGVEFLVGRLFDRQGRYARLCQLVRDVE